MADDAVKKNEYVKKNEETVVLSAPVLPLRDIVVFPHMIVPLFVGREKSVRALEDVMKDDKQILLVTQKNAAQDDPGPSDIYTVGTIGTVLQPLKLPTDPARVRAAAARGAGPARCDAVRAIHQAQQEDSARGAGLDQSDRGPLQAGRHAR